MRGRRVTLVVGILMVSLMLVALQVGASGSNETGVAPAAGGSAGPWGKYSPAIEITTVRTMLGSTTKYAAGDDINANDWTRAYEEELGIKLKSLWVVDSSQWQQKSNLMIASGDLPDFFRADGIQFQQLYDAGLVQDLTKAYNENVWDFTRDVLNEGGAEPLKSGSRAGKLYGIPHTGLPREGFNILFARTDWLKRLNLSEPKTMDDLLKISKAFAKQDPDGNGKDDTVGLVVDKALWQWIMGFMNGYHAYPNAWIKDTTGKALVYGSVQPEVKAALAKLAELYKDGQIDQEFAVKDYAKASELMTGGKAGLFYGFFWSPLYPLQPGREKDPSYDWKAFPPVSVDSRPALSQVDLGVYGYWVVRKGYKNPEAVVRMLNLWMKYFYQNTEDAIYKKYVNWDDGNEVWQNAWPQAYRAFKNVSGYINDNLVLTGKKKASEVTPEERGELEKIQKFQQGDQTNWCWDRIYGIGGCLGAVQYVRDKDLYLMNEFYGAPTPTMVDRSSTLSDKQMEVFTKIIMGTLPISAFDDFVKDWKSLGGDQITKEVNDWYSKKG